MGSPYSAAALDEVTLRCKESLTHGIACTAGRGAWLRPRSTRRRLAVVPIGGRGGAPRAAGHRRQLNAIYNTLPEQIRLPERFQNWRFHILVPEPDRVVDALFRRGSSPAVTTRPWGAFSVRAVSLRRNGSTSASSTCSTIGTFDRAQAARAVAVVSSLL
jgi:hypothetical protein